jgi:hypothetical protein
MDGWPIPFDSQAQVVPGIPSPLSVPKHPQELAVFPVIWTHSSRHDDASRPSQSDAGAGLGRAGRAKPLAKLATLADRAHIERRGRSCGLEDPRGFRLQGPQAVSDMPRTFRKPPNYVAQRSNRVHLRKGHIDAQKARKAPNVPATSTKPPSS